MSDLRMACGCGRLGTLMLIDGELHGRCDDCAEAIETRRLREVCERVAAERAAEESRKAGK